jgi:DNA-binding transcriptional MerR regulator
MAGDGWKVGELAKATGLTVRTLHHWDEIGLLSPSKRTAKGHRLYADADLARLQQVASLRQLGFPLEQIRDLLDRRGVSPRQVIGLHLARLREQLGLQRRLIERLERVERRLERAETVSPRELIDTIEATMLTDKYYTPEQQEQLAARAAALGDDAIRAAERDWATLIDEVRAEMERGTDPQDPRVQALARRWMELVRAFTGGDPGIERSVGRMWSEETTIHGFDTAKMREMMGYIQRALK